MEPNGIFLNKSFSLEEKQDFSRIGFKSAKSKSSISPSQKTDCAIKPMNIMEAHASEVTRSSPSATSASCFATPPTSGTMGAGGKMGMLMTAEDIKKKKGPGSNHCHLHHPQINNNINQNFAPQGLRRPKNKRPLVRMATECGDQEDENRNTEWKNNNNYYSVASSSSSSTMFSSATSSFVENSGSARGLQKIKSKSGVQGGVDDEGCYSNFSKISKSCEERKDDDGGETMEDDEDHPEGFATTLPTNPTSHSLLTWKLPSFLCLPFTNNENNNSYLHLVNSSSKSAGILSLTSLVLVVMAVLLASVPTPVMAATPAGEPNPVTDDITSNDVTSHDYPTSSPSILPVKLQTIQFTSPGEGTTPDDSSIFLSSAATGRTTAGSSGPSVTHQSIEGLKQEPSMNDFAGWKDADTLTAHAAEVETVSDKGDHHHPYQDDEEDLVHKEYEFKSGYPELHNETREALQEEGSNHQPVVFVGGSGYVPPNSIRTRPALEGVGDPLYRPVAESRYPVPLESAWNRNYRNPFNMTRVQHIEAECQDDFMKIRVAFNGSFRGLIYSSGYSYDPDCVYVNGSGPDFYEYLIKLNRCGTLGASNHVEGRREPSKNFMWNTVTVQYNPMIEEEWDEHFKVTCEYGYDFWKTVTFPFLDVEVATGNPVVFTLTPPECYMEVRYGFGTAGTRVGGPVRVGDPLTLMINMRSQYDGFDIVVNDCYAHNGATKRIQLIDHYGCPVDSKLMSPFRGTWSHTNLYETQVYAYLKTFRFTGSPALYIECDVRMCHGQCPAQPCYWRNVKSISKRSTDSLQPMVIADSEKNSTLSENLSLFQALRVYQEGEEESDAALKTNVDTLESVCMKTGAFTAMIGLSTFILVILTISTMIMCFRIRRVKVIEERETAADILRPYSHHVSQPSQHSNHHRQHHHWSSSKPR